jgi:hypothetical protein
MSCDLGIETDDIRLAASAMSDAADHFARPGRLTIADAVRGAAGHGSAAAREALGLAARRAEQGLAAADRLCAIARSLAEALHGAADAFDRAETWCSAGF